MQSVHFGALLTECKFEGQMACAQFFVRAHRLDAMHLVLPCTLRTVEAM